MDTTRTAVGWTGRGRCLNPRVVCIDLLRIAAEAEVGEGTCLETYTKTDGCVMSTRARQLVPYRYPLERALLILVVPFLQAFHLRCLPFSYKAIAAAAAAAAAVAEKGGEAGLAGV